MLINCQCHSAKVAPNANSQYFASNNLEYNNLKATTLPSHVKIRNHKITLCINYAFQKMFEKIARLSWKSNFYYFYVV